MFLSKAFFGLFLAFVFWLNDYHRVALRRLALALISVIVLPFAALVLVGLHDFLIGL